MCAEQQEHAQQIHATISTEQCFFPYGKQYLFDLSHNECIG